MTDSAAASRRGLMLGAGAALATTLARPMLAQGNATLTLATGGAFTAIDPHFYNAGPNNALSLHIFDRLIARDSRARLQPALAESWRATSETVWEFKLREGVTWHDGRPFTAEDVIFTIGRAPEVANSPGGFAGFLRGIARAEAAGPHLIRLHTAEPRPILPIELAAIAIVSRHAGDGATTEDYNSGRAAIGTGPYRFASYRPGDRVELQRNESWWGPRQSWERVSYRFIANDAARTAALLAGDVALIDQVPSNDLARLRGDRRVSLSEIDSLRVMYLIFDRSREGEPVGITDQNGRPLPRNPMADLRVRRALSLAVNRQGLVTQVMEGTATPTGQWLPPGTASHEPAIGVPPFDAEGARRLLAEAGYPNGFRVVLATPNDRYPNDARTALAVAQMWTRIGVRTEVNAMPWSTYSTRAARMEFGARLVAWGSPTGEASYLLVNLLATYDRERRMGANNAARYSNAALDGLTARATATIDDAAREALLREATRIAMEDVAFVPLFQFRNIWAHRATLAHEPRMDDYTLAMGATPRG